MNEGCLTTSDFSTLVEMTISAPNSQILVHPGADYAQRQALFGVNGMRKDGNGMEVYAAVRTILAVRSYQDKPVPAEAIDRILEAGRLSASSMNGQPWRFILIEDREALRKIGELVKTGPYIAGASFAVAVAIENTQYAVSDASRAIQNMLLTAWADGIGSNWAGFANMDNVKPVLGIPDELDLLAFLPFGYPDRALGKGEKKRKPRAEVVFRERYGQP
jgi:nitroreductase